MLKIDFTFPCVNITFVMINKMLSKYILDSFVVSISALAIILALFNDMAKR